MPHPIDKEQRKHLKQLGERIKGIRKEKGLSQQAVAHLIGKDQQSIQSLEKGNFSPSYLYLLEVCKGLDISIIELLKDIPE